MSNDDRIREEVEKTLHAFDSDLPLEPNPFLFTRIQAGRKGQASGAQGFVRDVGLRWIIILGILLVNLITVAHYVDWNASRALHQALVTELEKDFPVNTSPDEY